MKKEECVVGRTIVEDVFGRVGRIVSKRDIEAVYNILETGELVKAPYALLVETEGVSDGGLLAGRQKDAPNDGEIGPNKPVSAGNMTDETQLPKKKTLKQFKETSLGTGADDFSTSLDGLLLNRDKTQTSSYVKKEEKKITEDSVRGSFNSNMYGSGPAAAGVMGGGGGVSVKGQDWSALVMDDTDIQNPKIKKWMHSDSTKKAYTKRYGMKAEEKIIETAKHMSKITKGKTLKKVRGKMKRYRVNNESLNDGDPATGPLGTPKEGDFRRDGVATG